MTYELYTGLVIFACVTLVTPGPNNLMLMASGANFGFRHTIPHMLGVAIGFALMVAIVGISLMQIFERYPLVYNVLKIFSITSLLYLAWKIASAARPGESKSTGQPLTFLQAAAFQWVNPKAWSMALAAISIYTPSQTLVSITIVALTFNFIGFFTASFWTFAGLQIRRILKNQNQLRAFNTGMAMLLVATLYPVIFPHN